MLTRKGARDEVDNELAFSPKDTLPRGQLPTKSDVIERALNETNWRTRETALDVAQELIDMWMHCSLSIDQISSHRQTHGTDSRAK